MDDLTACKSCLVSWGSGSNVLGIYDSSTRATVRDSFMTERCSSKLALVSKSCMPCLVHLLASVVFGLDEDIRVIIRTTAEVLIKPALDIRCPSVRS